MLVSPFPEMKKIIDEFKIGWLLPDDFSSQSIADIISNITESEIINKKQNCKKYIVKDNWAVYEERLLKLYDAF